MAKTLKLDDFLAMDSSIIDVRTPAEYEHASIEGAFNIPLFENDERADVGTIYKQRSKRKAIERGLEIVGPKLASFLKNTRALGGNSFRFYCWRGGMRSNSFAWLIENCGYETFVLEGGYKAYRQDLVSTFKKDYKYLVLSGNTGSLKTEVLKELRKLDEQVIDLEAKANHMGSVFGGVLSGTQPSSEHFQNSIALELKKIDLSRAVWLEDESFTIGGVYFHEDMYRAKQSAPRIVIELPRERRLENLVSLYGDSNTEDLLLATDKISKRLGGAMTLEAKKAIVSGNLHKAVDIILDYYDKYYLKALKSGNKKIQRHFKFEMESPLEMAQIIKEEL